jgi:hypothetical protein
VLGSLLSATFSQKSLCSLFPNSQRVDPVDPIFLRALLEERDLVGVGALLPSLSFKDFHHAVRLRSSASGHLQG